MVWLFRQNCLGTVGVVAGFRVWLGLKIWLIWAIYLLSLCNLLGWSLEICLGGGLFLIGDLVGLGYKVGWVEYFVKFGGFSLVGYLIWLNWVGIAWIFSWARVSVGFGDMVGLRDLARLDCRFF